VPSTVTANLYPISDEFADCELGDLRLDARLIQIAEAFASAPDASLPRIAAGASDLEAFYRFFNNPRVESEAILSSHAEASIQRALSARNERREEILAISDTSAMKAFEGADADTFGQISTGAAGFFAHVVLLVGAQSGHVFGVAEYESWRRVGRVRPKRKMGGPELAQIKEKESDRWARNATKVAEAFELTGDDYRPINVMDREGDSYELLAALNRFIVRADGDRSAREIDEQQWERLSSVVEKSKLLITRNVLLSRREKSAGPRTSKAHPPRQERVAKLRVGAMPVELRRPKLRKGPATFEINVVVVREVDAPPNTKPVEWLLLTSESIKTEQEILAIVDAYRRRWLVEELFKAIKTGCAYNARRFESYDAMDRLLAVTIPVAWRLLALRALDREAPDTPATVLLTPVEIQALRARHPRRLPKKLTVATALAAIASLGGHLKNNGPPGWSVLYRGFVDFMAFAAGWKAAVAAGAKM
jgi:hypothetical protein